MQTDHEPVLAALAVDYWKLLRSFERAISDMPADRIERLNAQVRYAAGRLSRHLDDCHLQLVTFDGEPLTPSIPVIAINAEELGNESRVVVQSTIEPAIVAGSRVLSTGRVIGALGEE